ncbi:MAG: hypothetical protein FWC97_06615 [Treponema sp.]|nr:hypothetical protein [Treponema sp.]
MKKIFGYVLLILVLSSCSTTTMPEKIPAYEFSRLMPIMSDDFIVIAPIIIKAEIVRNRRPNLTFINARLMEEVIRLGGHDVINVRFDSTSDGRIIAVTGIVIKYINNVSMENIE